LLTVGTRPVGEVWALDEYQGTFRWLRIRSLSLIATSFTLSRPVNPLFPHTARAPIFPTQQILFPVPA
jgi:hypothetical protein